MIREGQPIRASVMRLKALGVGSIVFDPCSNVPEQGDFMTVMKRDVENL
jgi:zinc transport system substrate-binding protein